MTAKFMQQYLYRIIIYSNTYTAIDAWQSFYIDRDAFFAIIPRRALVVGDADDGCRSIEVQLAAF